MASRRNVKSFYFLYRRQQWRHKPPKEMKSAWMRQPFRQAIGLMHTSTHLKVNDPGGERAKSCGGCRGDPSAGGELNSRAAASISATPTSVLDIFRVAVMNLQMLTIPKRLNNIFMRVPKHLKPSRTILVGAVLMFAAALLLSSSQAEGSPHPPPPECVFSQPDLTCRRQTSLIRIVPASFLLFFMHTRLKAKKFPCIFAVYFFNFYHFRPLCKQCFMFHLKYIICFFIVY
ncbi:hypothetical protein HPP92_004770 [Vanilla planifolia]|uniref:Uncharacterized protein n=1 Tax=Vanilla planifolia TaxID=51239 RepID=A0A835RKG2_VANPL|nr:hypothetical protein HPP92_004770 [Vanilla planifolia]